MIIWKIAMIGVTFLVLTCLATSIYAQTSPPPTLKEISENPSVQTAAGSVTPRTADELIEEIETAIKTARRALPTEEFLRTHQQIVEGAAELQQRFPNHPCVAKFLPERWRSLNYLDRGDRRRSGRNAQSLAEIDQVLRTTQDPKLRASALFTKSIFQTQGRIDGLAIAAVGEAFARQLPEDNRAGELFYLAVDRLSTDLIVLLIVFGISVLSCAVVAATFRQRPARPRRRWRLIILIGLLSLTLLTTGLIYANLLPNTQQVTFIASIAARIGVETYSKLTALSWAVPGIVLSFIGAVVLVFVRRYSIASSSQKLVAGRLWFVGFTGMLAICCMLNIVFVALKRSELKQRLTQTYGDSFRGRMVQGQSRQQRGIGQPFELDFTDAISGRQVSIKNFLGKVVVVEFWATWCGPCVREIPEMQQLYTKYHDQGVEFIGISHDAPEEDGGLTALKAFVAKHQIPWPQFYESRDGHRLLTGSAMNDFSESWGIDGIPTIFIIDKNGNLYSTEARGKLDRLIPRLLAQSTAAPQ